MYTSAHHQSFQCTLVNISCGNKFLWCAPMYIRFVSLSDLQFTTETCYHIITLSIELPLSKWYKTYLQVGFFHVHHCTPRLSFLFF